MGFPAAIASVLLVLSGVTPPVSFALDGKISGPAYEAGTAGFEPGGDAGGFLWSAPVAEGNYRVTVTLGDPRHASVTTIKAESRRLMLRNVVTRPGQILTRSFIVNVRRPELAPPPPTAPGGTGVRLNTREDGSYDWDEKLTLEFLGNPKVQSISIAPVDVPTVYLVGDSTVTDQRFEPAASWGQMLPAMFDTSVAVANHAESGETLKSFITELRLDKALSRMKAGDYLFIQFGHNDQKQQWPQTYADPKLTYPAYLRAYIAEARRRGAQPVLVTPPDRRNFDAAGKITSTLTEYVAAMKRVATEEHVALIDLNADSRMLYEALGPAVSPRAFNDGGADKTHHDNYGAFLLANAVATDIKRQLPSLAGHIIAAPLDLAHPPLPDALMIAPSLARSAQRPAGS
ncbi:rhamnogalacturonan acetylesterase [Sphingomonas sp. GC_Shp_3]|uniref:rhamnogalacturonan acetylesterase n=1 Tax=Sphingomonas sp. GC_Shp_3 TaxID=2937383 RepID=UPI00226A9944|nr:rhamnogalacturonan acetylesterase [Sphingomonas sp. GC_Shp_3]